jgi:hypothetical protein
MVLKQNYKAQWNSEGNLNIDFDQKAARTLRVVSILGETILEKHSLQASVHLELQKTASQKLYLQVLENGKWTPTFEI